MCTFGKRETFTTSLLVQEGQNNYLNNIRLHTLLLELGNLHPSLQLSNQTKSSHDENFEGKEPIEAQESIQKINTQLCGAQNEELAFFFLLDKPFSLSLSSSESSESSESSLPFFLGSSAWISSGSTFYFARKISTI